jgi:anthranilate/para-aminobenzoate synthase component II
MPISASVLGHQALAVAFGGRVDRAPAPLPRQDLARVKHDGTHLFAGLAAAL